MKLSIKRCLFSFVMSTALAGTVRAQSESAEGVVRLGSDASSAAASAPQADPAMEGYATPYASPYGAASSQYGPPPSYGVSEVDRVFRVRGRVDARGGQLYGYDEGYTNIGIFAPKPLWDENSLIFADVRGMITNQGKGGANVGVGLRHYDEDLDRVFGASVWYDYDNSHVESYNQIGLSLESLGRFWDWRVNGYIPVGQDKNKLGVAYPSSLFIGHNIWLNRITTWEQAYHGFDTEVGGPFPVLGRYGLNGYVGFYYFTGANSSDFTGVSGRIQAQLNEDLTLGVTVTDDHTFGTNTQIQVVATLPDGTPNRWLRPLRVYDRLFQPVQRNYRAIINTIYDTDQIIAINPKDGLPYFVDHINPNQIVDGDGTVENPFNSIASYTANETDKPNVDIIYVKPRLDDSSANLNTGITLLTGQRLLSTSVEHTFMTPEGTMQLAGYVPDDLPVLTNPLGDVVTFADGANCLEVSGFTITSTPAVIPGQTNVGIIGDGNSFVMINRNTIQGGDYGVLLTDLSGTFAAGTESTFTENTLSGNLLDGLAVVNDASAPLDVVVTDNIAANNGRDGISLIADNGSVLSGLIDGNSASGNTEVGIHLASDSGRLNFNDPLDPDSPRQISNNTVQNNVGDGIRVDVTGTASADLLIIDNTAIGNENGIHVTRDDSAALNVVLQGNTTGSNTAAGVAVDIGGAAAPTVTISTQDTLYENNVGDGLQINGFDDAVVDFTSTRDIFRGNGGNGLSVTSDDNSVVDVTFTNATAQQNTNGAVFLSDGDSVMNVNILTNTADPDFVGTTVFEENAQHGVQVTSRLRSLMNFNVLATDPDLLIEYSFRNNSADGLNLNRIDASNLIATIEDAEFTGNGSDGLEFAFSGSNINDPNQPLPLNSPNTLTVSGSVFDSNSANGMNFQGTGDATLVANVSLSEFTNNTQNGIQATTLAGSSFGSSIIPQFSVFDGITVTDNGVDGIQLNVYDAVGVGSTQRVTIQSTLGETLIADNADDGIQFDVGLVNPTDYETGAADGVLQVLGLNTVISANGGNGIESLIQDDNPFDFGTDTGTITVQNATIGGPTAADGNGGDGVHMEIATGNNIGFTGIGTVNLIGATVANNAGDGAELRVDDGGDGFLNASAGTLITNNGGHGLNYNADGNNVQNQVYLTINGTVVDSTIQRNAQNGVNIDLEGKAGSAGLLKFYDPNEFVFDNNLIAQNGQNGIYYNGNAGRQQRFGSDGSLNDFIKAQAQLPQPTTPATPFIGDQFFQASAFARARGNTGDLIPDVFTSNFMNLTTSQNSVITITNNRIQFNGQGGTDGDGVFFRVSTDSYLGADVGGANGSGNGNVFTGNLLSDFRTESFRAIDQATGVVVPKTASVANGAPTPDDIYMDDTAQMDLRFFNNTGDNVNAVPNVFPRGAIYPGEFLLENVNLRPVQLFQLDGGPNVNASNTFTNTPFLTTEFANGDFHIRTGSSIVFPNANFPQNYNTNPGNPFLP